MIRSNSLTTLPIGVGSGDVTMYVVLVEYKRARQDRDIMRKLLPQPMFVAKVLLSWFIFELYIIIFRFILLVPPCIFPIDFTLFRRVPL